jgi:hypothetical protein
MRIVCDKIVRHTCLPLASSLATSAKAGHAVPTRTTNIISCGQEVDEANQIEVNRHMSSCSECM